MTLDRQQLQVVVTLGVCGLGSAADNWFVSPALPAIAQTLQILPTTAAVILTAYMIPYGGLQPVYGALGDGFGRLRLLRIIVLGLAVGTALCAVAPTLALLAAARVVTGCFAAGIITVSQAFVGSVVGHDQRGRAVGVLMGITFAGQGLSAGLGGILTELVGWRAAFFAFAALALVAWGLLFRLREPAHTAQSGQTAGHAAGIAAMFRRAFGIFFGPKRAVYALACSTGLLFLGVYGFMGTFLAERCSLSSTASGLVMMAYGVCCLMGGTLSGKIGEKHGLARVVATGECCAVCAAALLLVATATASWVPALAAAGLLGFGYIFVQPTLVTYSMDADPVYTGLCTGLIGLGVFVGGGVGSALGGALLASNSYVALWAVAAAGLVLQLIVSTRCLAR